VIGWLALEKSWTRSGRGSGRCWSTEDQSPARALVLFRLVSIRSKARSSPDDLRSPDASGFAQQTADPSTLTPSISSPQPITLSRPAFRFIHPPAPSYNTSRHRKRLQNSPLVRFPLRARGAYTPSKGKAPTVTPRGGKRRPGLCTCGGAIILLSLQKDWKTLREILLDSVSLRLQRGYTA
jgi:hypothetical protein